MPSLAEIMCFAGVVQRETGSNQWTKLAGIDLLSSAAQQVSGELHSGWPSNV